MAGTASLHGRVVLITGASSGLGERFARLAASAGAQVVIGARRTDRLERLADEIAAVGGRALAVPLDVTDEQSIEAVFDAAEARFGPVTSVIANAGISITGRATELAVDDFDRLFAVNVRGVFLTARIAARRLMAQNRGREGRIVLMSSITAYTQMSLAVAYSASKAAVTHMGRVMAREWASKGPNVTTISPGYIRSEMTGDWFDTEGGQRYMQRWPRKQPLEEDALDATLLYLLSDASAGVTGSDFVIDDGQSL